MNICRLFSTRPQSLGEGMRRVVCAAGGTKEAHLQAAANNGMRVVRKYTNGVIFDNSANNTIVYNPKGVPAAYVHTYLSKPVGYFLKLKGCVKGKQQLVQKMIDANGKFVTKEIRKVKGDHWITRILPDAKSGYKDSIRFMNEIAMKVHKNWLRKLKSYE